VRDRINLVYTDTPFAFDENAYLIARYADQIRQAALEALEEEAVLIAIQRAYHSG
jgi:hypothetical protein